LDGVLNIFLYSILLHLPFDDSVGLCGSFTICLIRHHILLLSSRFIFCSITAVHFFCFFSIASTRQSWRCTFLSPLASFLRLAFQILVNCRPSCSSSIVSPYELLTCCRLAKHRIFPVLLVFPSLIIMSCREACILLYHIWIVGLKSSSGRKNFRSSSWRVFVSLSSACRVL
jgi:hypothetical protein